MSSIKFRRDRPEMTCPHALLDNNYRDEGGLACLRIEGHEPPCISLACDAAEADGVCHACRNPWPGPHRVDCFRRGRRTRKSRKFR